MSPSTRTEFTLVAELLEARAAVAPRAVALVVDGQGSLTYGAWDRAADRLAGGLIARGTKTGDVVGLHFSPSAWLEYAIAYFAVQKAGGVAVPFRSGTPAADLAGALEHCGGRALLTDAGEDAPSGPWWSASPLDLKGPPAGAIRSGRKPTDPAEILHTSGTTGPPKGIAVSHESLLFGVSGPAHRRSRRPSSLHTVPFGTNGGDMLLEPLSTRMSRTVVMPAFEPKGFCKLIEQWRIRDLTLVPATAIQLVESEAGSSFDLGSVRRINLTGSRTPRWLLPHLLTLFPRATIHNSYSSTEAWPAATSVDFDPSRPGSVGRPHHGVDVRIGDAAGHWAGSTERGEIWLRSSDVSPRSYVNDLDATAETFVDGWARTGDIGYLDRDGYLYVVDRKDDVIDVGGAQVVPAEIEAALESFPGVVEAAAFGVADRGAGEQPVAAIVVRGGRLDTSELMAWARARLGPARAPRAVFLVDELPRNAGGKVLRRRLRESFRFQAPSSRLPDSGLEAELACIWNRALGVDVGADDDFFAVGGQSLAAIEIAVEAGKHFGAQLSIASVYEYPTVALLAKHIGSVMTEGPGSTRTPTAIGPNGAEPDARPGRKPSGAAVKGPASPHEEATQRWWAETGGGRSQNLVVLSERVLGPFDVGAFQQAFNALVGRHDALRTSFVAEGEDVYRVVTPDAQPPFDVVDATRFRRGREGRVRRLVGEQAIRPFPPGEPYRTNAVVYVLGDQDHVVQVVVDHLVTDDWSMGVMRSDLSALYEAELDDAEGQLPLTASYHEKVLEDRRWLASEDAEQLGTLRAERLHNFPWSHDLPLVDFDGPPTYFDVHFKSWRVPESLQAKVRARASELQGSPFVLIVAAFCALVHRYTGQSDHIMVTYFAGRENPAHKNAVGQFVRLASLRASTVGDPTYRELVKRTRDAALSAFADARVGSRSSDARRALFLQRLPGRIFTGQALTAPRPDVDLGTGSQTSFGASRSEPQAHRLDEADNPELAGLAGPCEQSPHIYFDLVDRGADLVLRLRTMSPPDLVETFLVHCQRALEAFLESPDRRISEICFLDGDELGSLGNEAVTLAQVLKGQSDPRTATCVAVAPEVRRGGGVDLPRAVQHLDLDFSVVPLDVWNDPAALRSFVAENAVSVLCADVRQLSAGVVEALAAQHEDGAGQDLALFLWGPDMPPARLWQALQTVRDRLSTTWVWTPGETGAAVGHSDLSRPRRRPTIEHADAGVRLGVVDAHGNIVPPGTLGRIVVEPRSSAPLAAPCPRVSEETAVATGYLGRYLLDGAVQLVSPEEDFARWRGFPLRFSLLEQALREHEAIRDAAVAIHTPSSGEDEVVALVVCDRARLRVRDLLVSLSDAFPGMPTPTSLRAVDRLPAGRGKADRLALGQLLDTAEECRDPVEPLTPGTEWVLEGLAEGGIAAEPDEPIYLIEGLARRHVTGLLERLNSRGLQVEHTDLKWWTTPRDIGVWVDQGGPTRQDGT